MKQFRFLLAVTLLVASLTPAAVNAAPKKTQASMSCTLDGATQTRYVEVTVSWTRLRVRGGYYVAFKPDGAALLDDIEWSLASVTSSGSHTETLAFSTTSLFGIVTWELYDGSGRTVAAGELDAANFPGCASIGG